MTTITDSDQQKIKQDLLILLTQHIGRSNKIGMGELFERLYSETWRHRINDTRKLRKIISSLKQDGVPICSVTDSAGGGYYLSSAGSELEDFLHRLRMRALKILAQEAKLRKVALPVLMGQITMAMSEPAESSQNALKTK